jgi:hypothetical protein
LEKSILRNGTAIVSSVGGDTGEENLMATAIPA